MLTINIQDNEKKKKEHHILSLSGGKDSAALAVYMNERYPNLKLEYVFIDSGCELPETYEYLDRIQGVLNIDITTITPDKGWENYWSDAKIKNTNYGDFPYLPTPQNRWCTELLKIKPYDKWLLKKYHDYTIHSYVGLRADEKHRKGFKFNSQKTRIIPHYPFIENGLVYQDILELLEKSKLYLPDYYEWRSRSGCYFCFYQTKKEWLGLHKHHPDLYLRAMQYETIIPETGVRFTWCDDLSLKELLSMKDIVLKQESPKQNGLDEKRIKRLPEILAGYEW